MSKYTETMNIGLAGEYMVAGMLSINGWYASLTLKNFPKVDIIAYRKGDIDSQIGIQVKSTQGQTSVLVGLNLTADATIEGIEKKIKYPYVFVVFSKHIEVNSTTIPDFYVVSRNEMVRLIYESNKAYFNKPRKRAVNPVQPIAIHIEKLIPFKDKWELLKT